MNHRAGCSPLAVEDALSFAGQVEVKGGIAHTLYPAAIHAHWIIVCVKEGKGGATVKMFFTLGAEDTQFFELDHGLAVRRQDIEQGAVGKADLVIGKKSFIRDPSIVEIVHGA